MWCLLSFMSPVKLGSKVDHIFIHIRDMEKTPGWWKCLRTEPEGRREDGCRDMGPSAQQQQAPQHPHGGLTRGPAGRPTFLLKPRLFIFSTAPLFPHQESPSGCSTSGSPASIVLQTSQNTPSYLLLCKQAMKAQRKISSAIMCHSGTMRQQLGNNGNYPIIISDASDASYPWCLSPWVVCLWLCR